MWQFLIATKNTRIVRFNNENVMMYALDGLLLALMHNVTRVDCFDYIFCTYFLYSNKICTIK